MTNKFKSYYCFVYWGKRLWQILELTESQCVMWWALFIFWFYLLISVEEVPKGRNAQRLEAKAKTKSSKIYVPCYFHTLFVSWLFLSVYKIHQFIANSKADQDNYDIILLLSWNAPVNPEKSWNPNHRKKKKCQKGIISRVTAYLYYI